LIVNRQTNSYQVFNDTDDRQAITLHRLLYFSIYIKLRLRWSRSSVLAFSTQVRGFKPGRSRRIFKGEKILSTSSFGGEVKPSVPCRSFAACKRSLNGVEVVISGKLRDNILAHSFTFRRWGLSRRGRRGGTWWRKLERLNARESNGKLPLRICPGCSVPEPYQSPD
jgi:hypothetical protein